MIKSKGIFAVSFIAMMVAGGAYANIASQGYVDQQIDTRQVAGDYATNTALSSVRTTATNAASAAANAQSAADDAQDAADAAASAAATAQQTANAKVTANAAITAGTATKITYDAKGLVTGGASLTASDIPTIPSDKVSGLSTVATSGSYNDLADKPSIPAAITVDSALSSTSTNPVQNKVINTALAGKLSTTGTAAKATADANGNNIANTYATKSQITALDSTSSGTGAVVTGVSQTDGKVSVTKGNVKIPVGGENATSYATIWVE